MKWLFGDKGGRRPNSDEIAKWLTGMKLSQKGKFREYHKHTQGALFQAIGNYMHPLATEHDGEVAYLLVHFCAGRGALPHFPGVFASAKPDECAEAKRIFDAYDWENAPTEFTMIAGTVATGEIINEALEEHYDWALLLANETAQRFQGGFLEPEILRVRGILRLALGDYDVAVSDLEEALAKQEELQRTSGRQAPPLAGLVEPLEVAKRLATT